MLAPAGLTEIVHCDAFGITPGLARGYVFVADTFSTDVLPTLSAVRFTNAVCGTAGDVARIPGALSRLLQPESLQALLTPEGPAAAPTTRPNFGLGVNIWHDEGRRWWGMHSYLLMGYSSSWLTFPDESLTVVVLANTERRTGGLGRNLARAVLGLPLLAAPAPAPAARPQALSISARQELSTTADERMRLLGTYRMRPVDPPSHHRVRERTFCVYEETGQLMLHVTGFEPNVLLKEDDSTFTPAGRPHLRFRFQTEDGRAVGADLLEGGVVADRAVRESTTCVSPTF